MSIIGIDHVALAMPSGEEATAVEFYVGVLGLTRVPKPEALDDGGCWFVGGSANIHLGIDPNFTAATKAHPALMVADFDGLIAALDDAQVEVRPTVSLQRRRRAFVSDPFGNRIELFEATPAGVEHQVPSEPLDS